MIAEPVSKLLAGELAGRLDHGSLAVRPAGLDRVEPRAPARQAADQQAAAAVALDPAVWAPDPGPHRAAHRPRDLSPERRHDPQPPRGELLGPPLAEGAG